MIKGAAAAGLILYASSISTPVYAQEAPPKPKPAASSEQEETEEGLVKKAEALFQQSQKAKTAAEQLPLIKKILTLYGRAEGKTPGDQHGKKIDYYQTVLDTVVDRVKADYQIEKLAEQALAKKKEGDKQKDEFGKQMEGYHTSLLYYLSAESLWPEAQYSDEITGLATQLKKYYETGLRNARENKYTEIAADLEKRVNFCSSVLEKIKQGTVPADVKLLEPPEIPEDLIGELPQVKKDASQPDPPQPAAEPVKDTPPDAQAGADKKDKPQTDPQAQPQPAVQPAQKTDDDSKKPSLIRYYLDTGGRIGINHSTKNDQESVTLRLGDYISGDAFLEYRSFQGPNSEMINRRTYAGTANASIPGLLKISVAGDNTEERQREFMQDIFSDPTFDITVDTAVRTKDANQYAAAMLDLGPIWTLGIEGTIFDSLQRIVTNINQVTYVENKTIPNGDYAEGLLLDERSKVQRRGGQAVLKYMLEHKGIVPFKGDIGFLFDYENTRIHMANSDIEKILSMHFGLQGKVNIADYFGLALVGAQQYVDAKNIEHDKWNSFPLYVAGSAATPNLNLGSKDKPFNLHAAVGGSFWYLENSKRAGSLMGIISLGNDETPIDFLNDYFMQRGRGKIGLRRELSDALTEFDDRRDFRMLPFTMYKPTGLSLVLFGGGGCAEITNFNNEKVQSNFGNIGFMFRNPYVSVGGTAYYSDDRTNINKGLDVILQFHELRNIMFSVGAYQEQSPRMQDDILGAEFRLIIPFD